MEQARRRQITRASIGFSPAVVVELEAVSPYNDINVKFEIINKRL